MPLRRLAPLAAAIVLLLVLFSLWVDNFLAASNMLDLLEQVSINTILALGLTLTIIIGGIDLSVGAVVALSGTVAVYVLSFSPPPPASQSYPLLVAALLAGAGAGFAAGGFNGLCAATTRMPAFIITLGSMSVARGLALTFNEAKPLPVPEQFTAFLGLGSMPVPVLVMLAVFLVSAVLLHHTRFGQHVYAIGGSREAARFTGIPLRRVEAGAYIISGTLAGLAGMIHASQLYAAEPASGVGFELDAIAAAVVGGASLSGGAGTMVGTLLGAIVIGILNKGLNQAGVHFSYQYMVKGAVILAAVYVDVRGRK
jgi:ribose transport system permease protein